MLFVGWIAMAISPFSGMSSVLTAALSAELGDVFGDGLWGGAVQNCIGLACFYLVSLFSQPSLAESFRNWKIAIKERPFQAFTFCFGGTCSAYYVCTGVLLPKEIGYGVFFVAAVCVEIITSLILEFTGFLWTEKKKLKIQVIIGSMTVLCGTAMFQGETLANDESLKPSAAWMIALAGLAGFLVVIQTAFNRKFSEIIGGPFRSLAFGQTVSSFLQWMAAIVSTPNPTGTLQASDWWKLLAGFCTFFTLSSLVMLPGYIGYAATYGWFIFGQLTTSLIIDSVGGFGNDAISATPMRIIGVLIVLFGVFLVQLAQTKYASFFPNLLRRLTCQPIPEAIDETQHTKFAEENAETQLVAKSESMPKNKIKLSSGSLSSSASLEPNRVV